MFPFRTAQPLRIAFLIKILNKSCFISTAFLEAYTPPTRFEALEKVLSLFPGGLSHVL